MNYPSRIPTFAAAVIILVTAASGPVVPFFDLTQAQERATDVGTGNITVDKVSLPATAELVEGRYGAGGYSLQVPDAHFTYERTSGRPVLSYEIQIPAFNYSRETVYFVDTDPSERRQLSIEKETLKGAQITEDRYEGVLRVHVRSDETERVVAERNITVEVQR